MDEFCTEKGFIGWYETSAKENINIDEAARFLVTRVRTQLFLMKAVQS
jgi:Ras-related protein Rab-32